MSDFLKRRIQERDEQRRGTQETSAPASSFLQQRIQQRDTQRAESGYRAPTGTHKTMLGKMCIRDSNNMPPYLTVYVWQRTA